MLESYISKFYIIFVNYSLPEMENGQTVLTNIREMNLLENLENGEISLELFKTQVLLNHDVVSNYETLLQIINENLGISQTLRITAKDILSAYLFVFFDFSLELKDVSRRVLEELHNPDVCLVSLAKSVKDYENKYLEWKDKDFKYTLKGLTELYWEFELVLELNRNKIPQVEFEDLETKTRDKQGKILKQLRSMDNLEYFYNYVPVVMDEDFVVQIHETLKKAYWDNVKEQLPNIEEVLKIIIEIKSILVEITPRSLEKELLENFDETFDVEYIKQLHEQGVADNDFWYRKCEYLYDVLCQLDSSAKNQLVNAPTWEEFHKRYDEVEIENKARECVDMLAFFMERFTELAELKRDFEA